MKKKKEIEIPKTEYIYQRYNGIITKYIVDKEYYIAVETGIATKKDETVLLGKVAENIIDLIEVSDYVNGMKIDDIGEIKRFGKTTQKCLWVNIGDGIDIIDEEIKDILTKEQYMQNCYKIAEESSSIN